ncbi:MAG: hypothetical protein EBX37_12280, partial [Alphaproteobacteria bacterium]|nr:hypothetical protein [Alphaproteobacteria bacterium]
MSSSSHIVDAPPPSFSSNTQQGGGEEDETKKRTTVSAKPLQNLESIRFGIYSSQEIVQNAVCLINNPKLTGPNSVYDKRMGVLETHERCITCQQDEKKCIGHFGRIELNVPIYHPLFYKFILLFLKSVCFYCSHLLLLEEQVNFMAFFKFSRPVRFKNIMEKIEKVEVCPHCRQSANRFGYHSSDKQFYRTSRQNKDSDRIFLNEREVLSVFSRIPDRDIQLMGFDPRHFHPKNLILTQLPVIPPVARPFVIAESNTCDDDLTVQYQEIVKTN